jgi:hypothetical protein
MSFGPAMTLQGAQCPKAPMMEAMQCSPCLAAFSNKAEAQVQHSNALPKAQQDMHMPCYGCERWKN